MERAIQAAVEKLGYKEVREKQKEAMLHFAQGEDVFISFPTGGGKSLCFYALPLLYDIFEE